MTEWLDKYVRWWSVFGFLAVLGVVTRIATDRYQLAPPTAPRVMSVLESNWARQERECVASYSSGFDAAFYCQKFKLMREWVRNEERAGRL